MLKTVAKGLWTAAMIISFTFAPSAHAQVQMSSNATLAEVLKGLFDKNGNFLQNNDQPEFIVNDDVIQRTAMTIAYFDRFPNDPKQRVAKDWAFQFIYSAHQYGLDWTIGPAFAQIESTGFANDCAELPQHQLTPEFMQSAAGQNYTDLYVNGFGWNAPHYDPCQARFRDYGQAIYHVLWNVSGKRPETAHFYAGKNKYDMLTTYNSVNKEYIKKFEASERKLRSMSPTPAQIAEAKRQWATYIPVDTNDQTPAMRVVLAQNE